VDDEPGEALGVRCAEELLVPDGGAGEELDPIGGRLSLSPLSRVVLDRLTEGSVGLAGLEGVRCEVERSREGVTVVGGEGAGRYADGALGFLGGAGGGRAFGNESPP
jgi:hypothetical protein